MNENQEEDEEPKVSLFKRIFVILIVLFISVMMILLVIVQPRFFTFVS